MAKNNHPTALVTGAARGIGRGIAEKLLAAAWNVVLADVLIEEGKSTAAELNQRFGKSGVRAIFVKCDVSKETQIAAAVKKAVKEFGRLDALVNNAGMANPYNTPVDKLPLAEWNRKIAVNLTGPCSVRNMLHRFCAARRVAALSSICLQRARFRLNPTARLTIQPKPGCWD